MYFNFLCEINVGISKDAHVFKFVIWNFGFASEVTKKLEGRIIAWLRRKHCF